MIGLVSACASGPAHAQRAEPPPVRVGQVPPPGPYAAGFDAVHYDVAITLPGAGTRIDGVTRARIRIVEPRPDTLRLDLTGLLVTRVRAGVGPGAPADAPFTQRGGRIIVPVPRAARIGDTLHIEVAYEGEPDDGLIIRANVHGDRSIFADDFPDRARFWFPSIDHPSDKATVSYEVTAPAGWEVVANGVRTGGASTDAQKPADGVWRWEERVPIPTYTMVIGATDFAIGTVTPCADGGRIPVRTDTCVPVTYWAYPRDSANAAAIFRRAGDMVEYFSRTFGPFPYEKLAHVQSATRFGGMENVGAIFYSEQAIAAGRLGETTVAHETAHQWFGDGVTESHWSHMWLSEGFATYFGMQYFEHADGVAKFRELLANSARGYLQSTDTAIAMVDTTHVPNDDLLGLLNTNSYNKGGQVLHMLRGVLGDSVFFAGIARYWRDHAYGNALTSDLQRALEQESGQDLGWFFEQWVYRPGYPVYRTGLAWDEGARTATVTVEQAQNPAWPTFRMPIEFEFETAQGPVRRTGMVSARRETLRFELPARATAVRLDPDGWLLRGASNLR